MKKLVFMFAAIVAVSFASCVNKTAAPETEEPAEIVLTAEDSAAIVAAVDTLSLEALGIEVVEGQEVSEEAIAEAKAAKVAELLAAKLEEVKAAAAAAVEGAAEEAAEAVEGAVEEAAEAVEEAAEKVAEEVAPEA
ncbi:MAG: hypothetical protein IJ196_04070 [Prevotella sp.]|nr:hypothetical protein [Prevotella sp.]